MPQQWRFIEIEERNAYANMSVDEAIMESVRDGDALPTIRFYRWEPSAVSIGVQQELKEHVDLKTCKELGVDYVRRITGGGTVFHDTTGEITYSVVAPKQFFPQEIIERFKVICGWIIKALELLDLRAEFEPVNDVTVRGKKISGSAQTIEQGVFLQHGTILFDMDPELIFSILKVGDVKLSDKDIERASERITSIRSHRDVTREEVYEALKQGFLGAKNYEVGELTRKERNRAKELAKEKYSTRDWNHTK